MAFLLKPLTRRRKGSKISSLEDLVKTQRTKLPCAVCITDIDPAEGAGDHFKVGDIILLERKLQVQYIRFEVLDNGSSTDLNVNNKRRRYVGREFLIPLEYEGFVTPKHKTYSKRTYYNCITEVEKNDLKAITVEEDTLSFTMKDKTDFIHVPGGKRLRRKDSVQYENQRYISFDDQEQNCYFFHEAQPVQFSAFPPIQPILLKDMAAISLPRIVSFNTVKKQNVVRSFGTDERDLYTILDGPVRLLDVEERDVLIVWKPDHSEVAIVPKDLQNRIFVEICKPSAKSKFFYNSKFIENKLYFLKDSLLEPTLFNRRVESLDMTMQYISEANIGISQPIINSAVDTTKETQNLCGDLPLNDDKEEPEEIRFQENPVCRKVGPITEMQNACGDLPANSDDEEPAEITYQENPLYREVGPFSEIYHQRVDHASGEYIDMDQHESLYDYEVMQSPGIGDGNDVYKRLHWDMDTQSNEVNTNVQANLNQKRPVSGMADGSEKCNDRPDDNDHIECSTEGSSSSEEEEEDEDFPELKLSEFQQGIDESFKELGSPVTSWTEHFPNKTTEKPKTENEKQDEMYKDHVKQRSTLYKGTNYPALPPKPVLKKQYSDRIGVHEKIEKCSRDKDQLCYGFEKEYHSRITKSKQNNRGDLEKHNEDTGKSSSRKVRFPNEIKERRKLEKEIYFDVYKSPKDHKEDMEDSTEDLFGDMPLIADIPRILELSHQSENETREKRVTVCVVRPFVKKC